LLSESALSNDVMGQVISAYPPADVRSPQSSQIRGNASQERRYVARARMWLLGMRVFLIASTLTLMASQTQALVGNPAVDVARWALLAALVSMFALRPRGGVRARKLRIVDAVFAAFITFAFASTLYSILPTLTIGRAVSAVLLYLAVFWTVWFYADMVGATKISDALLLAAAVMFFAGVVNAALGGNAWYALRFRGVFGNPNSIGMLAIIFLPAAAGRFMRTRGVFPLLVIGLILGSLVLSGSRNGVMTSSIAILFLLYRLRAWRASLVILAFATVVLLVMPPPAEGAGDQDPFARLFSDQKLSTGGGRLEAWQVAIPIIKEDLLLGHGFGTEELIFRGQKFRVHRGEYVHNSYLGMTFQLGLTGAAVLFLPLLALLITRVVRKRSVSIQEAVCEAILLGGLIASMFESWIYSAGNAFAFPFWIFVMLLVRSYRAPPDPRDVFPQKKTARVLPNPYMLKVAQARSQPNRAIGRFDPPTGTS
jgi:O-antigen ligase